METDIAIEKAIYTIKEAHAAIVKLRSTLPEDSKEWDKLDEYLKLLEDCESDLTAHLTV